MSKSEVIFEMDKAILDNIKKTFADKSHVEIGLLKLSGKDGVKAMTQEFGNFMPITWAMERWYRGKTGASFRKEKTHIQVPPRSFMRKTVAHKGEDFIGYLNSKGDMFLEHIVTGTWKIALATMGWKWKNYIQECFATRGFGQWAPLASFTVWDKGHDIPLFRTGRLQAQIESKVVEK